MVYERMVSLSLMDVSVHDSATLRGIPSNRVALRTLSAGLIRSFKFDQCSSYG